MNRITAQMSSRAFALSAAAALTLLLMGCSSIERANPRPESARVDRAFQIDVPQIMRGTVSSEAVLDGYQPVVARGYGLVVGLDGTGSRDLPPALRSHMLAEMARGGFGQERTGYAHMKPEAVLDSLDTAVVIVEAVIPPGAVGRRQTREALAHGTRFDVRVHADPRTGTRSLEGGRLYTTELRPGPLQVGGRQPFALAEAAGPIFINPFAEPGAIERDAVTRTTGVILNGGEVLKDMPLKLRLATPSHVRAAEIQNAINGRFPREPMQPDNTARGESDEALSITVPPSFHGRSDEFISLLRHTTVRLIDHEAIAVNVRRQLLSDPSLALEATWRWKAVGARAVPVIRELYDHPEEQPRFAALQAGAWLDDALVVPHLIELAEEASVSVRRRSIELLARMRTNPRIDQALRALVNDEDVEVRLAAYEGLLKRGDRRIERYRVGGSFVLDIVPAENPMIYITQFGQPRIVLFGDSLAINSPLVMETWSRRFMLKDIEDEEDLEVFFRPRPNAQAMIHRVSPELAEFILFLGRKPTVERPEPGLAMSYGEAVGAVYQIWRKNHIDADFKAEQDRILAAILRQEQESTVRERPEFSLDEDDAPWAELGTEWGAAPDRDHAGRTSDLERLAPAPGLGLHQAVPRSGGSEAP